MGFMRMLGIRGIAEDFMRGASQVASRLDPFVRLTMSKAETILCSNRDTIHLMPAQYREKSHLHCGLAIELPQEGNVSERGEHLRILWLGRIVPWKGLRLLLEALALVKDQLAFTLRVVGNGPDMERCRDLAGRLDIGKAVEFTDFLQGNAKEREFAEADVFVFTSLHDTAGTVLFEAMARGVPVVALDCGGTDDTIGRNTAILIPVRPAQQTMAALGNALVALSRDQEKRKAWGLAGRKYAEDHTWEQWAVRFQEIYSAATKSRTQAAAAGTSLP
jgi:glycosyltransferase involved in cell wall biosynthesis